MIVSLIGIIMLGLGIKFLIWGISEEELNTIAYSFQKGDKNET